MLPVLLHAVQRLVRLLVEHLEHRALVRDGDGADGGAQGDTHILAHQLLGGVQDLLVDDAGLVRDDGLVLDVLAEHDELVAAHAPRDIGGTDDAADDLREADQNTVAHAVAIDVVHQLEAVQVHHHQRAGGLGADVDQHLGGVGLVQQAGHGVGLRLGLQALDALHVLDLAHDVVHAAQQHLRLEGFPYVVHGAALEAAALVVLPLVGGHENDGDQAVVTHLQTLLQLQTGHVRHDQIREDHVGPLPLVQLKGLLAGGSADRLILLGQDPSRDFLHKGRIVHDQYFFHIRTSHVFQNIPDYTW